MIAHALFPVLVCEFHYPKHEEFKKVFLENGLKYFDKYGFSQEETGHVSIHHEPAFEELYTFMSSCIRDYLRTLHVDDNNFDINVVKSWLNVLDKRSTPKHSHRDAHISFTYYVNTPNNHKQNIVFYNYSPRMEPFDGCISNNNPNNEWDVLNSYSWSFEPKEGTIFVFPAQIMHDTSGGPIVSDPGVKTTDDLIDRRICIASDVLLTYKEKSAKSLGVQPVSNWRKFI